MKTLLITAFEPFGGESINPSELAVERLAPNIGGMKLEKRSLKVSFLDAAEGIRRYVDEVKPSAVICLGQAGGRAAITPERVAINIMDARIADNSGFMPNDESVVVGAPNAFFSTLPIKSITNAIERVNVKAAISNTAGTYVCNAVMYSLLEYLSHAPRFIPAGFIHVPYIEEQVADKPGTPFIPIDDIVRGITAAIECVSEALPRGGSL